MARDKMTEKRHLEKTKRLILAMVVFALAIIAISGCDPKKEVVENTTITISLSRPSQEKQLIYDNEHAIIEVAYDNYIAYLEQSILHVSPQPWEEKKASTELHFQEHDSLTLDQFRDRRDVANLIRAGHVTVYDKQTESYVTEIKMHTYAYVCGTLCGSSNSYFYIPNGGLFSKGTLFFEITNWNS